MVHPSGTGAGASGLPLLHDLIEQLLHRAGRRLTGVPRVQQLGLPCSPPSSSGLIGVQDGAHPGGDVVGIGHRADLAIADDLGEWCAGIGDDRQPRRHVVEEFGGAHALVEHRHWGKSMQPDVTGLEQTWDLGLGDRVAELDVRDPLGTRQFDATILVATLTDEQEVHLRATLGGIDDVLNAVLDAVRSGEHRRHPVDVELLAQLLTVLVHLKVRELGAIGDDDHEPLGIDAQAAEMITPVDDGDNPLSLGVDELLELDEHLVDGAPLTQAAGGNQ